MNMVQQFDPAQVDFSQDLGTPGAESNVMVTVQIDGMPVSVPEGTSVMRASMMARGSTMRRASSRRRTKPRNPAVG